MARGDESLTTAEVLAQYLRGRRDFSGTTIEDPPGAELLRGAVLDGADFSRAFIVADFGKCSLRGVNFVGANVKTCCFDGADLRGSDYRDAALDAATFSGALVEGASFVGATIQGHAFAEDEFP